MTAPEAPSSVLREDRKALIEAVRAGRLEFGGIPFVLGLLAPPATDQRMVVRKSKRDVVDYVRLFSDLRPERVLEVGMYEGGSTALFAELMSCFSGGGDLLATDLRAQFPVLDAYLAQRTLAVSLEVRGGVDQSDGPTLHRLCDEVFGDEPLDLIVDDASHLYGPTRATFEALFLRVRPGGSYVIEDWRGAVGLGEALVASFVVHDGAPPMDQVLDVLLRGYARTFAVGDLVEPVRRLCGDDAEIGRLDELGDLLVGHLVERHGGDRDGIQRYLEDEIRRGPARGIDELGSELLALAGDVPRLIRRIEANQTWIRLVRGSAAIEREAFPERVAAALRHPW